MNSTLTHAEVVRNVAEYLPPILRASLRPIGHSRIGIAGHAVLDDGMSILIVKLSHQVRIGNFKDVRADVK